MHPDHERNRSSWDTLSAVHGQDAYYDSEGLVAGGSTLIEEEEAALIAAVGPNISGLSVVHVQCHLGFDAITFARRGANVVGVDFSPVALVKAERLARRCQVDIEWLCADVTELPGSLESRFDLAWATMGVLCWIADVRAWMRAVVGALKPGGQLVMVDGYSGNEYGGSENLARPERRFVDSGCDYATDTRTGPQVQFRHRISAIAAAAEAAGSRVRLLEQHWAISHHLCIRGFELEEDGQYRYRVAGEQQPMLFTLIAERHRLASGA